MTGGLMRRLAIDLRYYVGFGFYDRSVLRRLFSLNNSSRCRRNLTRWNAGEAKMAKRFHRRYGRPPDRPRRCWTKMMASGLIRKSSARRKAKSN